MLQFLEEVWAWCLNGVLLISQEKPFKLKNSFLPDVFSAEHRKIVWKLFFPEPHHEMKQKKKQTNSFVYFYSRVEFLLISTFFSRRKWRWITALSHLTYSHLFLIKKYFFWFFCTVFMHSTKSKTWNDAKFSFWADSLVLENDEGLFSGNISQKFPTIFLNILITPQILSSFEFPRIFLKISRSWPSLLHNSVKLAAIES